MKVFVTLDENILENNSNEQQFRWDALLYCFLMSSALNNTDQLKESILTTNKFIHLNTMQSTELKESKV